MKLTPNENILRVALIVFSILFGILSISLIVLGVVYFDELWWPRRYVGLDFLDLPILLIVLGTLSLIMAIAGCLCAKTYNRKLLLTFGFVLLIILCLELTIAVIAFINFDKHEEGHTKTHEAMFKQYNSANIQEQIDFKELEDHYDCCGVTGNEFNCTGNNETISSVHDYNSLTSTPTEQDYYPLEIKGCALAVDEHIQTIATEVGYIAIFFSVLQVSNVTFLRSDSQIKFYTLTSYFRLISSDLIDFFLISL